jgi:hypothetical protein
MPLLDARRLRRRTRQALRVREWPWRRKIALGVWAPVAVVAFFLFTGPNGSRSGATTDVTQPPKTVVTVKVGLPAPNRQEISDRMNAFQHTSEDISKWVNATPIHLTPQQQHDMARWLAVRRKQLIQKHQAAVASSHHRDQKKP